MTVIREPDDSDHDLPDSIQSALKDRYGRVPEVSPEIDRAILADARQYLSSHIQPVRRHRRWISWRWMALASTMAAASIMLLVQQTPQPEPETSVSVDLRMPAPQMRAVTRSSAGHDIDQNGRVDILDAFAMARLLEEGRSDDQQEVWDVNGDGRFDQDDVDLVASVAVML